MGPEKAYKADACKIQNISGINNAFGDILKMKISSQVGKNAQQRLGQEKKHFVDQGQRKADRQSDDKGNDLVTGERRGKQTNA